jgi:hypothetical protein
MIKFLFFDYRDFEIVDGFHRQLEPPTKYPSNPVLPADHPAEAGYVTMYGSVVRRPDDGLWQMWYTVLGLDPKTHSRFIAYAESDDGISWRRPSLDLIQFQGQDSHLIFDQSPHGVAVFYDHADPDPQRRYKLITGAAPSHRISVFQSPDGIHWQPAAENPVIGINPDCPMSLHRSADGRYILYCRPQFGDRRVSRRESLDLMHWSQPRIVIDQEPRDHPQVQFYGLGAIPYGTYEIGTLWIYNTEPTDMGFQKMLGHQRPEFVYARSGYAWHRAEVGIPWIALGDTGLWDCGQIQPASAPVLLEDEIRFYYVGTRSGHGERDYDGPGIRTSIGFASIKPDRFVGVTAASTGEILTRPIWTENPEFYVNAVIPADGTLRVGIEDVNGVPIEGFEQKNCESLQGDSLHHRLLWRNAPDSSQLVNRELRLRIHAQGATLYALMAGAESELRTYWQFDIPGFLNQELSKGRPWLHR